MKTRAGRAAMGLAGGEALFLLACRWSAGFSRLMQQRLSRPAALLLHRLTSRVPFPVAEPLALLALAVPALALIGAVLSALRRRAFAPLARWLRGTLWVGLALTGTLALLWAPACGVPFDAPPTPDAGQLEWLCGGLIDALNASPLAFPSSEESLRQAPAAAGMPDCAVKAARYPEWMAVAGISGLFVPPTGEALADATEPAPLIPFTAVHELMHLDGVADEGAANIAAWDRCMTAGGAFADSARLWALRYALGLLRLRDEAAWQRTRAKMEGALLRVFHQINGEALPAAGPIPGVPGLTLSPGDYAALAGYLTSR